MKRYGLLPFLRSKRVSAMIAVLMLLVGAFPAHANYEHQENHRVAYSSYEWCSIYACYYREVDHEMWELMYCQCQLY
jgi:hypothetical protein